jgi:hypothetical protein
MIHSTSKTSQPGEIASVANRPSSKPAQTAAGNETLDTSASTSLRAALAALPEVRTEVVEKARPLVVDANYPPRAIIEDIARLFVSSQDLSNEA